MHVHCIIHVVVCYYIQNATFSSKVLYLLFCYIKTTNLSIKRITFAVIPHKHKCLDKKIYFQLIPPLNTNVSFKGFASREDPSKWNSFFETNLNIIPPKIKYNPCIQTCFCVVGGITSVICLSFKDF